MSFTRKMFRILTKRISTCLFTKKKKGGGGGVFSILVQNSPKVTIKVLVFRKVAQNPKIAKKLPSRIWKGLAENMEHNQSTITAMNHQRSIRIKFHEHS